MTAQKETAQEPAASGSLYVGESGTPRSPAIVFLHGVGNSGGMWAKHMASLGGYHCLALDLPGLVGATGCPGNRRSTPRTGSPSSSSPASLPGRRILVCGGTS